LRALTRSFYRRNGILVARELLGAVLCRKMEDGQVLRGRIVETEAYDGPEDRASHAYRGRTARNEPMFRAGGVAYVYLVYGMHHCMNVVAGERGIPSAVLLRAAEPEDGGLSARGPGRLARRFRIDRSFSGVSLVGVRGRRAGNRAGLWIEEGERPDEDEIRATARIGVEYAGKWARARLRFFIAGSPAVSRRPG